MSRQQMNNNGTHRMNGNNNRNNNSVIRREPVFRPNVLNEKREQISLFIPRVDARTSFEKVSFVFHHYYFGKVKNVDFILKQDKNGYDYKSAYVHFDHFYNSKNCCMLLDTIRKYGSDEVNCDKYDRNKMWKVFINTGKKHVAGQAKERLNLDLLGSEVEVDADINSDSSNIDKGYLKDYESAMWAEDNGYNGNHIKNE
jgi:hypothetical protein